ncbi:MAG: dihydrofolate reductase family protein [Actinobacteria bacterium]|nr:dihydrofolate reductase family protein [Actinomycetota bacterium]MCG2807966.1 dihydrofolate reductase family protein [Coriobacteriia bacterium]
MRDVLLNLTTSLDGFIADLDGGIDWLMPPPEDVPEEYVALMDTVDTLIMGRGTYETSLVLEGGLEVFQGKRVYVFTSNRELAPVAGVEFVHERPETFVARLKAEDGGTIWLFGGGQLATALSDAGLIDEYLIAIQPILLGEGIPLWLSPHSRTLLDGASARVWSDGLVVLRYRRRTTI